MHHRAKILALLALLSACSSPPPPTATRDEIRHEPTEIPAPTTPIGESIRYTLSFDDAKQHYLRVRAEMPAPASSEVELSMAVWTPGSYLVREYARNLEDLRVIDSKGTELALRKTRKNRWSVKTGDAAGIVVEYRVYCRESSVRTNFVDSDLAILNGAPTFLTLADGKRRDHELSLELPSEWKGPFTGLESTGDSSFVARGYDELVDSPIIAGRELHDSSFEVEGVPHHLVHLGDVSQWDTKRVTEDVGTLAQTIAEFWGVVPYESYHFLNAVVGGGGGLEHLDSTLMLASPFGTRTEKQYDNWLGLVSHEFFHTWNIKRLRPSTLGPFDYENENYTRSLWVAEGITSYYDDLLMRRANLITEKDYLGRLGGQIQALQNTPGRLVQPLGLASYDAWIKHYRRDENTNNTAISYYTKGAVVAFLLDAEIRRLSRGQRSLDDLMRTLYERYSGDKGYTVEEFRATASEVAGSDLSAFFARAVDGTEELDYEPALAYFGLELSRPDDKGVDEEDKDKDEEEDAPAAWLGAKMGGDTVRAVKRDTPAYAAGLNVDDEIIAIDGYRKSGDVDGLLARFRPGQSVRLTVSRRGRLKELPLTLGEEPESNWKLATNPSRSQEQRMRTLDWLQGER